MTKHGGFDHPTKNRHLSNKERLSLPKTINRSNPQNQFQKSKFFLSLKEQSEKNNARKQTPMFRFKTKQLTTHI